MNPSASVSNSSHVSSLMPGDSDGDGEEEETAMLGGESLTHSAASSRLVLAEGFDPATHFPRSKISLGTSPAHLVSIPSVKKGKEAAEDEEPAFDGRRRLSEDSILSPIEWSSSGTPATSGKSSSTTASVLSLTQFTLELDQIAPLNGGLSGDKDQLLRFIRLIWSIKDLDQQKLAVRILKQTKNPQVLLRIVDTKIPAILRQWLIPAVASKEDSASRRRRDEYIPLAQAIVDVLKRLPMTLEALKGNQLGKVVRLLAKVPVPDLAADAEDLMMIWKRLAEASASAQEVSSTVKSSDQPPRKEKPVSSAKPAAPKRPAPSSTTPAPSSVTPAAPVRMASEVVDIFANVDKKPKPKKPRLSSSSAKPAFESLDDLIQKISGGAPTSTGAPSSAVSSNVSSVNSSRSDLSEKGSLPTSSSLQSLNKDTSGVEGGASGKDLAETGGKRKRRVRWAPDSVLCSYRFIEPRQTESHHFQNARDMERAEGAMVRKKNNVQMEARIPWESPPELKIPRFIQQKLASCKSEEARTQQDRENTVLAAVYFEDRHIPPSPSEMDVDGPRTTAPPLRIIPMHDTTQQPSQQPAIDTNVLNQLLSSVMNQQSQLMMQPSRPPPIGGPAIRPVMPPGMFMAPMGMIPGMPFLPGQTSPYAAQPPLAPGYMTPYQGAPSASATSSQQQQQKPICRFYKLGQCRRGDDCKFRHD